MFVHRLIEGLKLGSTSEKPLISLLTDLSVLYKYHGNDVTNYKMFCLCAGHFIGLERVDMQVLMLK